MPSLAAVSTSSTPGARLYERGYADRMVLSHDIPAPPGRWENLLNDPRQGVDNADALPLAH